MSFYRRNLPHWQPAGAEYFVTFRLAGSLPKKVIVELQQEKEKLYKKLNQDSADAAQQPELRSYIQRKIFKKYESALDKGDFGPVWLKQDDVATVVKEAIHFRDNKDYELYAYCIMSNHVHMVFRHLCDSAFLKEDQDSFPVTGIMESLKKFTARECNQLLNRTGNSFWQAESYDHVIRDAEELENVIFYTLNNPVKAGLAGEWRNWPHTYCKLEFTEQF